MHYYHVSTYILVILFNTYVVDGRTNRLNINNEKIYTLSKDSWEQFCSNDDCHLGDIKRIEIINSQIDKIEDDAFVALPKLKSLNLSNTNLTQITFNISTLRTLYLHDNNLEEAPKLENFPNLHEMILRNNKISKINYSTNKTLLQNLDLSFNPLASIVLKVESMKKITILGLPSFNNVSFDIQCLNLETFDTNHITDDALRYNICKNTSAIIYTFCDGMVEDFVCSTMHDFNLSTIKTTGIVNDSHNFTTNTNNEKIDYELGPTETPEKDHAEISTIHTFEVTDNSDNLGKDNDEINKKNDTHELYDENEENKSTKSFESTENSDVLSINRDTTIMKPDETQGDDKFVEIDNKNNSRKNTTKYKECSKVNQWSECTTCIIICVIQFIFILVLLLLLLFLLHKLSKYKNQSQNPTNEERIQLRTNIDLTE